MKNLGKRPKCPDCGGNQTESRGSNWLCALCGRNWVKFPRGHRWKKLSDRPKECPECTATGILSYGDRWKCKTCGISWVKKKGKPLREDMGQRPKCPDCGVSDPTSSGLRWVCTKCGRYWVKEYCGRKKAYDYWDLHQAKVVEI